MPLPFPRLSISTSTDVSQAFLPLGATLGPVFGYFPYTQKQSNKKMSDTFKRP